MNPQRLQNKINRLLSEIWENCPKSYQKHAIRKKNFWVEWLRSSTCEKILDKYKAEYLNEGASRIAIEMRHAGKKYVVKVCYNNWADQVKSGDADDDNHVEIVAMERARSNLYTRTLVLPMAHYFYSDLAGWITVYPKCKHIFDVATDSKYNRERMNLMGYMTEDAHMDNVAYWKGFVWLIDYNCDHICEKENRSIGRQHRDVVQKKKHRNDWRKVRSLSKTFA